MSGSRLGRPARMGKPLLGMFNVFLYSMLLLLFYVKKFRMQK